MKMHLFAPAVFAFFLAGSSAYGQIKLPVFSEGSEGVKNVVFLDATQPKDFQHGHLVRIQPKGSDKAIQGILVRVDGKSERVFVRTQPGALPRAFDAKDITKFEKGTIKQVGFTQDIVRPEIQPMVIANGVRRTVSYSAPTLSPSELAVLRELEASENNLQTMEVSAARAQMTQDIEFGIQAEHLKTQQFQNELLWRQIYSRYNPRYMPWYAPVTANTSSVQAPGATSATVAVTSEILTKARQNAASVQNRLIYESGQLVAVIPDDAK